MSEVERARARCEAYRQAYLAERRNVDERVRIAVEDALDEQSDRLARWKAIAKHWRRQAGSKSARRRVWALTRPGNPEQRPPWRPFLINWTNQGGE